MLYCRWQCVISSGGGVIFNSVNYGSKFGNVFFKLIMQIDIFNTSCEKWPVLVKAMVWFTWWRHQMETFSALLAICAENSPVPGEFSTQRPVTRSFDVYFDLRPNIGLSKQLWGWWFETQSCPLWRHRNELDDKPLAVPISTQIYVATRHH